ncbi:lysophospholipid acyltransferase family protein [Anaerobranca gottschalkii]|uniref:1-acyl-sn-glycerol-3-phosphate acyltransferase n=1 Tax=Anaerobranca gottschalkii DSM 13577 TaxID=1120990 RepID=A0A1H9ZTC6_9FIRM|nr:lysophospholipid acyltransferase family protein [Anaerobranca gottschalkii]SES84931.1 1-acyl-sn-glycerol-3-phosphate acyltransferase [Anaerobranca gottschalkii DSM 13577]
MIKSLIVAAYVIIMLILSIPYLLIIKLCKFLGLKKVYSTLLNSFLIFFCRSAFWLAGVKVEVEGLENLLDRNMIFVGNHQSMVDIPVMLGYIPGIKGFIAKKETKKLPIINWWMEEINCVFLDRHNIRQGMKDMAKAKGLLEEGKSLVIYPEGTRSKSDQMGEFKKGSLKIGVQAGVPIVPVAISGSYKIFEEERKIKKGKVKVKIGEPIFIERLSEEEKKDISQLAYERVKGLLEKIQKP